MTDNGKYFNHPNAYKIKFDGAVAELERLHQQIAMLEMRVAVGRTEGDACAAEISQLAHSWKQVAALATMVLETQDYGRAGYFDPEEADETLLEEAENRSVSNPEPRKLDTTEQDKLLDRFKQWETQLATLEGKSFRSETELENMLDEWGLECVFDTKEVLDKSYRFCQVLWPHAENEGEWVEAVELDLEPREGGIFVSEVTFL